MNPLISDNYENDKSDRSRLVKDRIIPGMKSKGYGLAGGIAGAAVGAGMGLAGRKAMSTGMKKVLSSDATQAIKKTLGEEMAKSHENYARSKKLKRLADKPARIVMGPEMAKARTIAAAGAGAMAMAPKGKTVGKVMGNTSELKKNYVNQFGVEPTEHELLEVSKLNPSKRFDRGMMDYFYTPESMTKSTFRNTRHMMNPPESIMKNRESRMSNQSMMPPVMMFNPFTMPKTASEEYEKIASKKDIIQSVTSGLTKSKKVIDKVDKASPLVGGAIGSAAMLAPSYALSGTVVDSDDKNKKLKRAAITTGGALLGGTVGSSYLKNGTGLVKGVADKASNPVKTVQKGVSDYMDMVKNASDADVDEKRQESANRKAKKILGFYGITGGSSLVGNSLRDGSLDGVKKMKHVTNSTNVENILEQGIKATTTPGELTARGLVDGLATGHIKPDDLANKVYLANDFNTANNVKQGKLMNGIVDKQKTLNVNMPVNELKNVQTANPEILGAKNPKEFLAKKKQVMSDYKKSGGFYLHEPSNIQLKGMFNVLGDKGTTTIEGDVASKFIKGSKDFEKNNVKKIMKHISENPKLFAKGLGRAGAGLAVGATGAKLMHDGMRKKEEGAEKEANYFMGEIEKTANRAVQDFMNQVNTANSQRAMSQEQFDEFAKKMNEVYGANTKYVNNPDPGQSFAIGGEQLQKINPHLLKAMGIPTDLSGKNYVQSIPLEEVLLHETGHILDKDVEKTNRKAGRLDKGSHLAGMTGYGIGSMIGNGYASAAAHGAGTASAAYLKNRSGKTIEKREDDANTFAKQYMLQKHNGNQGLADEEFKKSTLGAARKTYEAATKAGTVGRAAMYGLPGAYNVYSKMRR